LELAHITGIVLGISYYYAIIANSTSIIVNSKDYYAIIPVIFQ
jgi:hypothetical protein